MLHKRLVFGLSFVLAFLIFLVVFLFTLWTPHGPVIAAVCGVAIFVLSAVLSGRQYQRCSARLHQLAQRLQGEKIVYADIASFMERGHEYPGAIVVTTRRFVFEAPRTLSGQEWKMDFLFANIAMVKNIRGYFRMAAGGYDNRFKVFRCDELVEVVQKGINYETDQRTARKRATPAPTPGEEALSLPQEVPATGQGAAAFLGSHTVPAPTQPAVPAHPQACPAPGKLSPAEDDTFREA